MVRVLTTSSLFKDLAWVIYDILLGPGTVSIKTGCEEQDYTLIAHPYDVLPEPYTEQKICFFFFFKVWVHTSTSTPIMLQKKYVCVGGECVYLCLDECMLPVCKGRIMCLSQSP